MASEAWAHPATGDDVKEAVRYLVAVIEPGATDERATVLARLCATRGWTRAEWLLLMREAPFANHYGNTIRLDVLEGIVQASRDRRGMLKRRLTEEEMMTLCAEHPELDPKHFGTNTFDAQNRRIVVYAPGVARADVPATPLLEEAKPGAR